MYPCVHICILYALLTLKRCRRQTWARSGVFDENRYALTLFRNDLTLTGICNSVTSAHWRISTTIHRTFSYLLPALLL